MNSGHIQVLESHLSLGAASADGQHGNDSPPFSLLVVCCFLSAGLFRVLDPLTWLRSLLPLLSDPPPGPPP